MGRFIRTRCLGAVLACLLVLWLRPLPAADAGCPDAELFSGKLITDICWACLFPIRIAGLSIGGGERPDAASDQVVCVCSDGLGVPHPGFVVSMWEPARIVELTRAPACSPALGGIRLPLGSRRLLGTAGKSEWDASDINFYNYHWYAFPLLILLDLFYEDRCNPDGMLDFDILSGRRRGGKRRRAARLALLVRRHLGPALSLQRGGAELRLAPERDQPLGGACTGGLASARAGAGHHGRRGPVRGAHRALPAQVPVPHVHVLPAAGDPIQSRHRRERLPLGGVALAARSGGGPSVSALALE
jgi:hypothetical protein